MIRLERMHVWTVPCSSSPRKVIAPNSASVLGVLPALLPPLIPPPLRPSPPPPCSLWATSLRPLRAGRTQEVALVPCLHLLLGGTLSPTTSRCTCLTLIGPLLFRFLVRPCRGACLSRVPILATAILPPLASRWMAPRPLLPFPTVETA